MAGFVARIKSLCSLPVGASLLKCKVKVQKVDGGNVVNWNEQLTVLWALPTPYKYYKSLLIPRTVFRLGE